MGIYNYNIEKSTTKSLSFFDKATKNAGIIDYDTEVTSQRPSDGFLSVNKDSETVLSEKINVIRYRDLWNLTRMSDTLQIVLNVRGRKTFRSGFDIEACSERANKGQKTEIENWMRECNSNGQSLKEVFVELDNDINWADDSYLLCLKDYGYNSSGEIVAAEVKEFVRLHPLSVELVLDKAKRLGRFYDTENGNSLPAYFDPKTRLTMTSDPIDLQTGRQNLQAHYRVSTENGFKYYNKSEIMHKSAFNPSLTYGYSPLFSLYQKVLILMLQDSYIKKYYGDDKPIKGLLVFNTKNKQALMKTFDEIRTKTQQNPHSVKPIIAESDDGRKPVEYIDMAKTLNEMQYTSTREEIRQQIGAMYGVSLILMNDMSTGGGLNNEGLQMTVTNEVIQDRQELFNNSFVKFVFEDNLGFTEWNVTIRPDVEQDMMAEEQLKAQELANAETKLRIGLKGKMTSEGEIKFDEGDLKLSETPQEDFIPFNLGKSEVKKAEPNIIDFQKADDKELPIPSDAKPLEKKLNQELKDIFEDLDIKGKVTEKKLLSAVGKVNKKLEKKLRKAGASVFKGVYEKASKETNKQLGTTTTFGEQDKTTLELLKQDPKYQEAFTNLSLVTSEKIRETIENHFDKGDVSINNLIKDLEQDFESTKGDLRKIVRTETGKIASASRKTQLNKTGAEYKYFHIGPNDNRTTQLSKNLEKATKKGVSWEEYINIMKKESKKFFPEWTVNENAPLSHYQSRHIYNFERVD